MLVTLTSGAKICTRHDDLNISSVFSNVQCKVCKKTTNRGCRESRESAEYFNFRPSSLISWRALCLEHSKRTGCVGLEWHIISLKGLSNYFFLNVPRWQRHLVMFPCAFLMFGFSSCAHFHVWNMIMIATWYILIREKSTSWFNIRTTNQSQPIS